MIGAFAASLAAIEGGQLRVGTWRAQTSRKDASNLAASDLVGARLWGRSALARRPRRLMSGFRSEADIA